MSRVIAESVIVALLLGSQPSYATIKRDPKAVAAFKRSNPCPSTGKPRGACPGYIVDHIKPLCAGGADKPSNMQWQTVKDAMEKDKEERRECRK